MRGLFIVVEGLDRAGKTTQCDRLCDSLRNEGQTVELLKFPNRTTTIGKMIDAYLSSNQQLSDQAIHLLFSANRWEFAQEIIAKLKAGITLVVDRYVFSGVAFTAAKGLDPKWCRAPDVGLPQPDIVLFLSVSPEVAAARGGYGEERYENPAFQNAVRQLFQNYTTLPYWRTVDADQNADVVAREMQEACRFEPKNEIALLSDDW